MSKVLNKCTVKTENENSLDDFIRGYRMKHFISFDASVCEGIKYIS